MEVVPQVLREPASSPAALPAACSSSYQYATCQKVCVRQDDPARLAGWETRRIVQNRSAAALELRSHCRNPKWGYRANDALHRTLLATVSSAADVDKMARRVWPLSPDR